MSSVIQMDDVEPKSFPKPSRCFCQIPPADLLYWGTQRYLEAKPTLELLSHAQDAAQQEAIIIVSLIDLDDVTMLEMMSQVDRKSEHILSCRQAARELLEQHHILKPKHTAILHA